MSNISWYVLENDFYNIEQEIYLGSYSPSDTVKLTVQVWNNRYGQEDSKDIDNAKLSISFEKIEDTYLLNYCTVSIDNNEFIKPNMTLSKGIVDLGDFSGAANDGTDSILNKDNFKKIILEFKGMPNNLTNGLKSMFLDIEHE